MKQLLEQAIRFNFLINNLKSKGLKKKELANHLEMPAPVFSSLSKTVLPRLLEIDDSLPLDKQEELISQAFSLVNNLSQTKIVSKMELFVLKLEELEGRNVDSSNKISYFLGLRYLAENSYNRIKKYHEGLYDMYYLSSDRYCIKKDSFMIRCNSVEKIAEAFKGNNISSVSYHGIAVINNSHTLTIQLIETDEKPEEFVMMHLSIPFSRDMVFLRGLFSCLNFSRQPIARKVVIVKKSDNPDQHKHEAIAPEYYPERGDLKIPEIEQYLLSDDSKIECRSVANPEYGLQDLIKELNSLT